MNTRKMRLKAFKLKYEQIRLVGNATSIITRYLKNKKTQYLNKNRNYTFNLLH